MERLKKKKSSLTAGPSISLAGGDDAHLRDVHNLNGRQLASLGVPTLKIKNK